MKTKKTNIAIELVQDKISPRVPITNDIMDMLHDIAILDTRWRRKRKKCPGYMKGIAVPPQLEEAIKAAHHLLFQWRYALSSKWTAEIVQHLKAYYNPNVFAKLCPRRKKAKNG